MTRIVLVDDGGGEQRTFRSLDWAEVDVFGSVAALRRAVEVGSTWDVAFVDFFLGEGNDSGLSAWLTLLGQTPRPKMVTFTQFSESGRNLYAAACKAWFQSSAALDKGLASPEHLKDFVQALTRREDPTQPPRKARLRSAYLINDLFSEPSDLLFWRAFLTYRGDRQAIASRLNINYPKLRRWCIAKAPAVNAINDKIIGRPEDFRELGTRPYESHMRPLLAFVQDNRLFFEAPDMPTVLAAAAPWDTTNRD